MLISDRDIRAEIDAKRIVLDPYDPSMVQPSSVDVRIDRYFRLFDNHRYAYIDPAEEQPELTRMVEVEPDESFILHPGEFALASTSETVTLPDAVAARLAGKSSLGRLGLLTPSTAGLIDPAELLDQHLAVRLGGEGGEEGRGGLGRRAHRDARR